MKTKSSSGSLLAVATLVLLVGFVTEAKAGEPIRVPPLSEFQERFGGAYVAGDITANAAAAGLGINGGYDVTAGSVLLGLNAGLDWTGANAQPRWRASLLGRVSAPVGRVLPYVQGGLVFDGANTGWEAGAGVALSLDQQWSVEFGASHIALRSRETSTLQVGLRFDIPAGGSCEIKELCPPPPPPKEGGAK